MTDVYNVTVKNNTGYNNNSSDTILETGSTGGGTYINRYWYPYYPYTSWNISYPTTVYMYQITCPKCSKMNWMKLDEISKCPKCHSKIKPVLDAPDYTVPVTA